MSPARPPAGAFVLAVPADWGRPRADPPPADPPPADPVLGVPAARAWLKDGRVGAADPVLARRLQRTLDWLEAGNWPPALRGYTPWEDQRAAVGLALEVGGRVLREPARPPAGPAGTVY